MDSEEDKFQKLLDGIGNNGCDALPWGHVSWNIITEDEGPVEMECKCTCGASSVYGNPTNLHTSKCEEYGKHKVKEEDK